MGGDFIELDGVNGEACVLACVERAKNNPLMNINGVTTKQYRCWCNMGMTGESNFQLLCKIFAQKAENF